MLARSGSLPTRGRYAFELKWDGFRCLLSTENGLRARSRRGWDMTDLLPELSSFPAFGTFDGELVAFDSAGAPDFPLVCERMLMRRRHISVVYVVFDVLSVEGVSLMRAPYSERRAQLESLDLNGPYWRTPETFDDGEALFEAVCERDLEGIVAKRLDGRYRPGERGWIKIKNRDYWRYEIERESAINNKRRQRVFV
jgi:bifunctional non-homologous end joining protein LigD